MSYIWDEKKLLEIIENNEEYSNLFDNSEFETLRKYMENDGYLVTKQFLNGVIADIGIDLNDNIIRAAEMKYTIVGTQGEPDEYTTTVYNKKTGNWDKKIKVKKYIYRYAGLNNKGTPTTLTMNTDAFSHRVYFKDYHSAKAFFDKFVEYPKIKNRANKVDWKIIPISKRNYLGDITGKGIEMELVNSPVGDCYQIA